MTFRGLMDALVSDVPAAEDQLGRSVILGSQFVGGPRYMMQAFQDSMAVSRHLGLATYFITFTCNPTWPEIMRELRPGEKPLDRPDIIVRVFHMKLEEFLDDLLKGEVFGTVTGYNLAIEHQKRGYPHGHLLLIMDAASKLHTTTDIDAAISAEIPDPQRHPLLYERVSAHMIHGPCGQANTRLGCMLEKGVCERHFPKDLQNDTVMVDNAYPLYRRRGRFTVVKSGVQVGDQWVVPYNAYLLLKFNCHINVESCGGIGAIKYLYKYQLKGPDRAAVAIEPAAGEGVDGAANPQENVRDEIKQFVEGRYLSAQSSAWRLFGFDVLRRHPNVERLQLHLPLEHHVYFRAGTFLSAHHHTSSLITTHHHSSSLIITHHHPSLPTPMIL